MVYNRIQHLLAGDPILFSDYFFRESFFRGNANKLFVNSLSIATSHWKGGAVYLQLKHATQVSWHIYFPSLHKNVFRDLIQNPITDNFVIYVLSEMSVVRSLVWKGIQSSITPQVCKCLGSIWVKGRMYYSQIVLINLVLLRHMVYIYQRQI